MNLILLLVAIIAFGAGTGLTVGVIAAGENVLPAWIMGLTGALLMLCSWCLYWSIGEIERLEDLAFNHLMKILEK